ncbi:type II secretion system F family protein [Candidatus Microgenomates bacterium]|nr:type II secretion system F family protein [Candidatus Microgenomates bacterium]
MQLGSSPENLANKSIPLVEKGNFCRYLATMIRSGTPILEAVDILSQETQNKTLASILVEIKNDLQKGKSLGESFKKFPRAFDKIFLTIITAGEESGTLDRSLEYLGKQILADYALVQKVRGALLYPLIIVVAMTVMGFVMLVGVLPRIAKVFLSSGLPIPGITKALFETSLFFERNIIFILLAFAGLIISMFLFFTRGSGGLYIKKLLPRLPVVKTTFSDLDIARFTRVLGTLLQSGVPIIEALKIGANSLTLPKYTKLGARLEIEISKGASIKDVLHKQGAEFPKMVTGMIAIGEETGTLQKVLFDIADFYDAEVEASLKNFTTVLEPVLMVGVGIVVALMALSIITPIYSLMGSLQIK